MKSATLPSFWAAYRTLENAQESSQEGLSVMDLQPVS